MATPGRGGPHTCSSAVSGGPSIALADLFAASAPPVLTLCVLSAALSNAAPPLLWQIRGRRSSGYGQHTWPRGNRQEMHGHLAGSLNSWPHRSAMWQEERTTMWEILFRNGNLTSALAGWWRRLWAGSGCGGSGRAPGWCGWAVSSLLRRCCGGAVCWQPVISLLAQSVVVGEVG